LSRCSPRPRSGRHGVHGRTDGGKFGGDGDDSRNPDTRRLDGVCRAVRVRIARWGLYSGQLDDLEETKFIPFDEREPQAWPGRQSAAKGCSRANNVLRVGPEIFSVIAGTIAFLGLALAFAFSTAPPRRRPGAGSAASGRGQGRRARHPDGFIDSFSGVISEPVATALHGVADHGTTLVCYVVYLFLNWKQ